jgi:hypothetical protein
MISNFLFMPLGGSRGNRTAGVEKAEAEAGKSDAASHASSVLLDALHVMLDSNALMTGPLGQVLQQQLLHLVLCTLTPLLNGLYTWLYDNWEDHFPGQIFLICQERCVAS